MTDKQIIIDGYSLKDLKDLLFTGQRDVISTKTFEAIIETLERKEQKCEELKKQLESTKGLITVGNRQLVEALKENEALNKINDEKNELLAKLGCPTTATAKRKVLCLQQQINKLKEDNEELRKNILLKCPNCGEEYLSPEGAALYEENTNLKKRLRDVENESNI